MKTRIASIGPCATGSVGDVCQPVEPQERVTPTETADTAPIRGGYIQTDMCGARASVAPQRTWGGTD